MRYTALVLALLFLTSLSSTLPATSQNPQETSAKPLYRSTGNEAVVTGTIFANGEIPKPRLYDMSADPVCVDLNRGHYETEFLVANNQRLLNAFVYVRSGEPLTAYSFEVADSEVVLEHKNCRFSPRVLGIRVGQPLSIVNSDPTQHNTHPTPKLNQEWNQTQAAGGPPIIKAFKRPEVLIPIKCNQHPWEKAYLGVVNHPFFAVSDAFGNYEIRGLPPGTYKLVVWHEELAEQEIEITVLAGENRKVDFTLQVMEKPGSPSRN